MTPSGPTTRLVQQTDRPVNDLSATAAETSCQTASTAASASMPRSATERWSFLAVPAPHPSPPAATVKPAAGSGPYSPTSGAGHLQSTSTAPPSFPRPRGAAADRYDGFDDNISAYPEYIRTYGGIALEDIPHLEEGLRGLE